MIADSTFLIDLLKGNKDAARKLETTKPILIPAIGVFEIITGAIQKNSKREIRKIASILNDIQTLNLTKESAIIAAHIDGELILRGLEIGPLDCMIAGIAIANNETLLTRNLKHFTRIKGLKLETY